MIWDRVVRLLDNPIFIKHVRSRLRIQPLATSIVVVLVFCLCIAWAGYRLRTFQDGRAFEYLLMLQGILLMIMGASQVSAAVGGAKNSGILDFHRVSPLTSTELTLGFFFGAPIREYVLFACTLPFSALCLAMGVPSVYGFLQFMVLLFATAWVFQGMALLNALAFKVSGSSRGAVVLVLFFVVWIVNGLRMGRAIPTAAVFDEDPRLSFFGWQLPWLGVVLLYQVPLLFFLFLAGRRKMDSARNHPLSKPQAVAALVTVATLVLGWMWQHEHYEVLEIVGLYILVVAAILLAIMVTPSQAEYYKGLWRAQKQGRRSIPPWEDLAVNWTFLALVSLIVLAAASLERYGRPDVDAFGGVPIGGWGSFPLAIATGVLVVAYFGLALQFFLLRFAGRGQTYFALFLFLIWIVPVLAGSISAMASAWRPPYQGSQSTAYLFALSPAGLGMIAAIGDESYRMGVRAAAVTPALLFTFVFNSLLVSARRRIHKAVLIAAARTKPLDSPGLQADEYGDTAPIAATTPLGIQGRS
jgi:hypothetical protein